jgi:hypothetical protein
VASAFGNAMMRRPLDLHVFLYRSSRGKVGGEIAGGTLLLLTVVGRKSGRSQTIPLAYVVDGGDYVVAASAAGAARDPAWYLNLTSAPAPRSTCAASE